METFRFDCEYKFGYEYDFLETIRYDYGHYEYEFDYRYDLLETFRFDCEYEFCYEYDFLETFRYDYGHCEYRPVARIFYRGGGCVFQDPGPTN